MNNYLSYDEIEIGPQIEPIKRIFLYSPNEWEEFTEEWLENKENKYIEIEKLGGAGDKGRDVVAYINKDNPDYKWDCYQCKHYQSALSPSDVWIEFAKIIYYTFISDYPILNKYYFVAPKGIGSKLTNLLKNQKVLQEELILNWDQYCKKNITKTKEIPLEGALLSYCKNFNFLIFDKIQIKTVIKEYKEDKPKYVKRFGGGLPSREKVSSIPNELQHYEIRYTKQLTKAYNSDNTKNKFENTDDFKGHESYHGHFSRARESFHTAEQLRNFSRDNLGEEAFDELQYEIYQKIVDLAVDNSVSNGFKKVKNIESEAMGLPIQSNALKTRCVTIDKKGICHQLVNDKKITWIKDDE